MKRTWAFCLGLVLVAASAAWCQEASQAKCPGNVILIGWDGAQRGHIAECLERGELPALKKLGEEGALVNIDVVTGATDTKAGWTQILTGYNPETTGVYNNKKFRDVPEGLSVFERLKKRFGDKDFVCVAVIGKLRHCGEVRAPFKKPLDEVKKQAAGSAGKGKNAKGSKGQGRKVKSPPAAGQPGAGKEVVGEVVDEGGVKYLVFAGSPYYTMHKSCDVWEYGLMEDEKVGERALALLEQYKDKPFFFFVHFATVDHYGHRFGENSKEYNAALVSNDAWTGKIVQKLKDLGLYDKTCVYVTADHGFDEGSQRHHYAPYVMLATNDKAVKRDGMRQDIAPTILAHFGLDLGKLEPKLDGEPLSEPATKPVLKAPKEPPAWARRPAGNGGNGKKTESASKPGKAASKSSRAE